MWLAGQGDLPGQLIVVSGPSGSGKSTVIQHALARADFPIRLSISATTRKPRPGEQDGREYYFWTSERFIAEENDNQLLESAVYNFNSYGTPARAVYDTLKQGISVLLEIEVQGAMQVRELAPSALYVFIRTRNFGVLEQRLRNRGTEDDTAIHRRLQIARHELDESHRYDALLINDDLNRCVEEFLALLKSNGCGG